MDEAVDLPPHVRLDRQDIAAIAGGDEGLLEHLPPLRGGDDLLEARRQPLVGGLLLRAQTPEEVALLEKRGEKPLLVSAFEDCRDWAEVYGKAAVESWMADADRASALANQLFIAVAERVRGLAGAGRKVMYHCAGGTDRAGRVSLVVEAKEYGVTREQVRAYKGPFSDPKIDLIVVDYLLSQRSGLLPQYRYFFPDLKDPAKSWLYQALEPLSADTTTPALEAWSD